jgi:dihydrofolate synthase/folylpolyglutamate synthase
MTYEQTLDYLFSQLPMFQRVGQAAYKADLNNTIELCAILNHPENSFKSVHIAGTNGKGSTSHMLASILQEAGYKVGLYTSPHLKDFRERIRINGEMIPQQEVIDFVTQYQSSFENIGLSFFEWTVGLAFDYFRKEKVDVAILETGMGGRLDSTNVVTPLLSIITNIGFDHQQFLGDTLEKIAGEKAGIIKPNIPVVIGETKPETREVFTKTAQQKNAPIYFADQLITPPLPECELKGSYQQKNIKTVLQSIKLLQAQFTISEENITNGLKKAIQNTHLQGRWQTISTQPKIIIDVAHNESGIRELLHQLKQENYKQLNIVFGAVNDKDITKILNILPKEAHYFFCQAQIPRALDKNKLFELATAAGLTGTINNSVEEALIKAKEKSSDNDLILVFGSIFVVAEIL